MLTDSSPPSCGDVTLNKSRQSLVSLFSYVEIDLCFTNWLISLPGNTLSHTFFQIFSSPCMINYPRKASTDLQDLQAAVRGGVFSLTRKWY